VLTVLLVVIGRLYHGFFIPKTAASASAVRWYFVLQLILYGVSLVVAIALF